MDSPLWSPCSIIGQFCLVDHCCQFIWSFECIHCPPHLGVCLCIFNFKCLSNVVMCLVSLFPSCSYLFAKVGNKRLGGFAIAQANPSLVLIKQDVHTHSTFIAFLPFFYILVHLLCAMCTKNILFSFFHLCKGWECQQLCHPLVAKIPTKQFPTTIALANKFSNNNNFKF